MSITSPEIFDLAARRLVWAGARQAVLAQDVANLTTPGFQAEDVAPFQTLLAGSGGIAARQTDQGHLAGPRDAGGVGRVRIRSSVSSPDKNNVRLEEQLMKIADTETINASVTAIFKKYISMFNIVTGKGA